MVYFWIIAGNKSKCNHQCSTSRNGEDRNYQRSQRLYHRHAFSPLALSHDHSITFSSSNLTKYSFSKSQILSISWPLNCSNLHHRFVFVPFHIISTKKFFQTKSFSWFFVCCLCLILCNAGGCHYMLCGSESTNRRGEWEVLCRL